MTEKDVADHLDAGRAAIGAAMRCAGPSMGISDLVRAIVVLFETQSGMAADAKARASALDLVASSLTMDVVRLVGARRARELVDQASAAGGDPTS